MDNDLFRCFCYWLDGFLLGNAKKGLSEEQLAKVKAGLDIVWTAQDAIPAPDLEPAEVQ